jgi:hypothetical protein
MRLVLKAVALVAAILPQPVGAFAAEPVKRIAIYVQPYYQAAGSADEQPQKELRTKALAWLEQNPYQAMFMDRLTAKSGDRAANLKLAIRAVHLKCRQGAGLLGRSEARRGLLCDARAERGGCQILLEVTLTVCPRSGTHFVLHPWRLCSNLQSIARARCRCSHLC